MQHPNTFDMCQEFLLMFSFTDPKHKDYQNPSLQDQIDPLPRPCSAASFTRSSIVMLVKLRLLTVSNPCMHKAPILQTKDNENLPRQKA